MAPRTRTYVALLRGINLAGRNRVSMPELRSLLSEIGAEDVETYLQSGNAVFASRVTRAGELRSTIERRIVRDLGLEVTVLLRKAAELDAVLGANPFAERERDPTKLHVTFLAEKPGRTRVSALDPEPGKPDELRVLGREVYLHCPNGYGRTKLTNAWVEAQLGTAATTRNWKTVTKLAELAAA